MRVSERVLNLLTVATAACAITVTSIVVFRQLDPAAPGSMAQGTSASRKNQPIGDWSAQVSLGHQMGPDSASLTVVYFGDFECPACRGFAAAISEVRRKRPNDVRVVFRHFPLPYHRFSYPSARAAECASDQGRFEEMYRELYAAQDSLGLVPYGTLARRAGVADLTAYEGCMNHSSRVFRIERDRDAAVAMKIPGTPGVIINGTLMLEKALTADDLLELVDDARRTRRSRALDGK